MKANVDHDLCTGCGICIDVCPDVFEMPDDLAITKVEVVPEDVEDDCREAAEQCPVDAIEVQE
jgi:ferredoxin